MLLVGHVTKDGALAGPRVLEHMVDAVIYFESDSGSRYRIVRSVKNRFGTVNELGIFAMTGEGLKQVKNPSAIFLSGSRALPGSCITVIREGTRPMLLELQALVDDSHLANPRRVALGLDGNRLAMLLAVLHRHGGVAFSDQDVFINVVGGMRLAETACDLPLALALQSSFRNQALPEGQIVFGEVGLGGEIRPVPRGKIVEHADRFAFADQCLHQVGTDEPCAAGNQDHRLKPSSSARAMTFAMRSPECPSHRGGI